ncbi:uncharacterized protein MELLADRAFT_105940 [Melampsora larici-populina 98AG31]|uniref:Uncharacterized protein n=1 Tax=Melampsora larici-populina (strain 98AG31 / pathotype 3-4-7) TaxID=747676 RepID=F4RJU4_MELLP|nr:uncharacterized protein MELLADRAFT_105940 [Melampsora larici-populina 98AG31]EGG07374.1 hypothetical protein MELLADRAFT_105940 [Melampsora larici-populina 98AG31]
MSNKNRMRKVRHLVTRGSNSNVINDALNAILPTLSTKDRESATQTIDKVIEKVPELIKNNKAGSPVVNLIDSVVNSLKDPKDKTNQKTPPPPPPPNPVNEPHGAAKVEAPAKNNPKPSPIEQSPPPQEPKDPIQTLPPEVMSPTPESGDASNSYVSDNTTPKDKPDNNGQPETQDPDISENPQGIQELKEEPKKEETMKEGPVKELTKEAPVQEAPTKAELVKEAASKEAPPKEVSNQQEINPVNKDLRNKLDKGTSESHDLQTGQTALTNQTNNPSSTETEGQKTIQGYSQSVYSAQENQKIPTIQHSNPTIGSGEIAAIITIIFLLISGIISFIILRSRKRQNITKVLMFESVPKPKPNSKAEVEVKTENPKKSRISIPPLMREFYGFPIPGYLEKRKSEKKTHKKRTVGHHHHHNFV